MSEQWNAGEGMEPDVPQNENHTVDEEEPENADEFEDVDEDFEVEDPLTVE